MSPGESHFAHNFTLATPWLLSSVRIKAMILVPYRVIHKESQICEIHFVSSYKPHILSKVLG